MDKDQLHYKFKTFPMRNEYDIVFTMMADNKLFNKIFTEAKIRMKRQNKLTPEQNRKLNQGNSEDINEFEVPQLYYSWLQWVMKKFIRRARDEMLRDKIEIYDAKIKSAIFRKEQENEWTIILTFWGSYIDRRTNEERLNGG